TITFTGGGRGLKIAIDNVGRLGVKAEGACEVTDSSIPFAEAQRTCKVLGFRNLSRMTSGDDCDDTDDPLITGKLIGGIIHGHEDRLMHAAQDTMGTTVPSLMTAKERANQVKSPIPLSPT